MGSYDMNPYSFSEPIAIVGSSCRLPGGATSPAKLWTLLTDPSDIIQEIPPSRFDTKAFYHQDSQHHGSTNTKYAYLLEDDPRTFDRDFFNISPKEAEAMDPQQRCLLEVVYEGIESAGYSVSQLRGSSTGVFIGAMSFDYQLVAMRGLDSLPQYHATGGSMAILANRISYFYDWRGPSLAVDTACSSSLVALHQAVLALRNGDVNMAVTAGSNLILGPEPFIAYSNLNMLSPNGRSYMWDSSADGYTRGEGFAAIVLKTLSQAIADGDHIESIIRETGVNSDGRTPGITMPSADAQARLIRDTYAKCGLDPTDAHDRPQYFEAHGTGTPAGDPVEASAIHSAFFSGNSGQQKDGQLLVGSIKTVLGHTEGTAGLAGVLKASLAVQHGQIPRNLHFRELNHKIRPFEHRLRVPITLTPWPAVPKGQPRRVSVNSFGFGGTNAHAIIESWDEASEQRTLAPSEGGLFVLSANSAQALTAKATTLSGYLRKNPNTDPSQLAHTLFQRADFPFRASFSAMSVTQLADKLEAATDGLKRASRITAIPESLPPRILGVFTGQGAQWATMGKELYQASYVFRKTLDHLQHSLDSLPKCDRPNWSLIDELSVPKATSRVSVAIISQPLCTALQVALVDVLYAAGMQFSAVVGHSSGEIAAAYAAGYIDAQDAIRIAYYRGYHAHLAQGPDGERGKMIAVGMSFEQSLAFCNDFGTALRVAASNSPTSCTLAGDAHVIDEAKERLDGVKTFARMLAVDTAYHSHHMQPCAAPYFASLRSCGIKALKGARKCRWYSSVWGANGSSRSFDDENSIALLGGQYWVDNLTKTVQFSQAVNRAISEEPYMMDLALEIGPHPALKGPSLEVIKILTGVVIPYGGLLKRGEGDIEAFANGLGLLWTLFPSLKPIISSESMLRAFPRPKQSRNVKLKGLPSYPWDHDSLIWRESRTSRNFRTQDNPHELLGHAVTLGEYNKREIHWRQVLKLSELPWVRGHTIQGQVLFPATGYLTMAYEAAVRLLDEHQVPSLIELHDIELVRTMSLQEDSPGLEVLFTIRVTNQSERYLTAEAACYSGDVTVTRLDGSLSGLTAHFSGRVRIQLGPTNKNALPARSKPLLDMNPLDMEHFYSHLSKVGYNYSEPFRANSIDRYLNHAVVSVPILQTSTSMRACMCPAILDTAVQGLLAAFSYPEDGRLGTVYLPTAIDCVRINMAPTPPGSLMADSFLTSADAKSLTGDVDLFSAGDANVQVQMCGVHWTALNQSGDRWLYANEAWARDAAHGIEPTLKTKLSSEDKMLSKLLVRTAYFFLRRLRDQIKPSELILMGKHRKHMMKWVREHLLPQVDAGKHTDIETEWSKDTIEDIQGWSAEYLVAGNNDMHLLHAVGKNLPAIARGTMPALQVLLKDGMLNRLYMEGVGFADGNLDIEVLVGQLAHRYPRMKVIEIGAGTGGTTKAVLSAMGDRFTSYMYTDVSAGFFEPAKVKFSQHTARLSFKMLDIEKDPVGQGFEEESYDMVIASNCLHATRTLQNTLRHCRSLVRPGGYLVLLEITRDHLPIQLIMGTLPGWFLGAEEGRTWAPTISLKQWDTLLKGTGFSGVDTSSTASFCSVIMSQAVDSTVQMLREPLLFGSQPAHSSHGEVLVIGGATHELGSRSQRLFNDARAVAQADLEGAEIPKGAAVLCLCDLDRPIFTEMTDPKFQAVQELFRNASAVLWVTSGAISGKHPLSNVMVGLGRTLLAERGDLRLQFLDVDDAATLEPSLLVTSLLRLKCSTQSETHEILWTHEAQLALREGALYVPRIMALDTINRRSAARYRSIVESTSLKLQNTTVEVVQRDGILDLLTRRLSGIKDDQIRVQITASSLHPLVVNAATPAYVCIGRHISSGEKLVVLSRTNSSVTTVNPDQVLYRFSKNKDVLGSDSDAAQLCSLMLHALATSLLCNQKGPVWIHGASSDLSCAIDHIADWRELTVLQTTSDKTRAHDQAFIHPYVSKREIQTLRPNGVEKFINMEPSKYRDLSVLMRASLPYGTTITELEDVTISLSASELYNLAEKHLDDKIEAMGHADQILAIEDVTTNNVRGLRPTAVIAWSTTDEVTTVVRPIEHDGLFAPDKTYVLFGMTGDVGISIARWMVENGARNIILASRTPNVPAGVIEFMLQKRAILRPTMVDVTSKESLRAAYDEIKCCMPPVAGIINGAMVLRDRLFNDMSWADFEAVLAPKVAGTQNLDELFDETNDSLDFFIVLSSATSFVGTIGQSAYSAANHFMASLVRQRHERGLAGSVLVIGFLTGLGYIFRSEKTHLTAIEKSLLPRLDRQAETDLHEMLAEAIVCGRDGSGQPSELITGIRTSFQDVWHEDPRLSCYLVQEGVEEETGTEEANGNVKVEVQLSAAEDPQEGLRILVQCFSQALGRMLQLDPAEIASDVPVADLGVDSLISIGIREWFLKELGVDVPVLKLMSTNHSLARVCEDALAGWRKLPGGPEAAAPGATLNKPEIVMDWGKEVDDLVKGIATLIPPGAESVKESPRKTRLRVVLTGCTGFLGTHMIRELVESPDVAELHCLCIRSRHVKIKDSRIREYAGDLAQPLLGLSIDDFTRLTQTADLIIHLGAEVNHLKSYTAVRAANVVSTQTLLAMATPRRVPVHFISSSSVAMLQKDTHELAEIPASHFSPPNDAESLMGNAIGYAASKWVGEVLLEQASAPGIVHRFPNIMGPDAPDEIPLVALDRYCTRMRAVPALDPKQWVGQLDIIDVSDVVPEFLANARGHDHGAPFAVHNYCSENSYWLSDLAGMYKEKLGGNIDVLPTVEWMRKAKALGMPKGVEATFTGHDEVFISPVLRKGSFLPRSSQP